MRLCVQCKHHEVGYALPNELFPNETSYCARKEFRSPVTGLPEKRSCAYERMMGCGPEGDWWQKKSTM